MQKDVFDHNFQTKALRMMILVSKYVFEVKESDAVICFNLWPWPLQNHILGYISVINGQNVAKF